MALMFCLLPLWIWIWVGWVTVLPVMFVENTGLVAAMGRSWRLIEGRWWRTFLILFLVLLIWYVVQVALGGFLSLASGLLGIVVSQYVALAISQAATAASTPVAVPL